MKKQSAIKQVLNSLREIEASFKGSDEYYKLLDEVIKNENALLKKLESGDLIEQYEKTKESIGFMNCELIDNYYADGFRFGFLLALDIFKFTKRKINANKKG